MPLIPALHEVEVDDSSPSQMSGKRKEMREPICKVIKASYSDYPARSRLWVTPQKREERNPQLDSMGIYFKPVKVYWQNSDFKKIIIAKRDGFRYKIIRHYPTQIMQWVLVIWSMDKKQALKLFRCSVFSFVITGISYFFLRVGWLNRMW
jgi:hypothetical protein